VLIFQRGQDNKNVAQRGLFFPLPEWFLRSNQKGKGTLYSPLPFLSLPTPSS
jgi:hypothetical protein